jgi:cytochrome c oxidase subunit 2
MYKATAINPFLYYFLGIDNFSQLSIVIYFVEPASVFFTNLIYFHDEVCIFLVYILVFTYWMLYIILDDHIYTVSAKNKELSIGLTSIISKINIDTYNTFTIRFFIFLYNILFYIKDMEQSYFFKKIENYLISLNHPKADKLIYYLYCFTYFIKVIFFSIFGFQSASNLKFTSKFLFFKENNLFSLFENHYNVNNKLLFSGCDSNILSIQGKFLEMEDIHSLSKLSVKYNLVNLFAFVNNILVPNIDNMNSFSENIDITHNTNKLLKNDLDDVYLYFFLRDYSYNMFESNYDNGDYSNLSLVEFNTVDFFWDIYNVSNSERELEEVTEETYRDIIKCNNILSMDLNFQESFYYARRLNQISYYYNPYLEIFNGFFDLNENNNLSVNEASNYKWWEFKYLYTIIKGRNDYLNLSNLSSGINRDIVIHSWEYHHSMSFEYIWALFPTIVILSIVGPSFILLYSSVSCNDAFFTVKVIGHQWYWSYEICSDNISEEGINFESHLKEDIYEEESKEWEGTKRLLTVDKHLILLAHKPINFFITSADVLHAFAVPSMGLKVDAVPGRINTCYLAGSRIGIFYGQCSELCGFGHGFMPIVIEVLPAKIKDEEDMSALIKDKDISNFWNRSSSK